MKRAICAILFTTLVASSSQAGYVGTINLASGSGANGSLGVVPQGDGVHLTGTNLAVPTIVSAGGTTTSLNAYLDFQTGVYTGNDSMGNSLYSAANSNFFILPALLSANFQTPLAKASPAGPAVVKILTGSFLGNDQEYELTMNFTLGFLYPSISTAFGVSTPGAYTGTLDMIFVNNSNLAGNQLIRGSISFTSVPEPSSLAMVVVGGLTLVGFGGRRVRLSRAA